MKDMPAATVVEHLNELWDEMDERHTFHRDAGDSEDRAAHYLARCAALAVALEHMRAIAATK